MTRKQTKIGPVFLGFLLLLLFVCCVTAQGSSLTREESFQKWIGDGVNNYCYVNHLEYWETSQVKNTLVTYLIDKTLIQVENGIVSKRVYKRIACKNVLGLFFKCDAKDGFTETQENLGTHSTTYASPVRTVNQWYQVCGQLMQEDSEVRFQADSSNGYIQNCSPESFVFANRTAENANGYLLIDKPGVALNSDCKITKSRYMAFSAKQLFVILGMNLYWDPKTFALKLLGLIGIIAGGLVVAIACLCVGCCCCICICCKKGLPKSSSVSDVNISESELLGSDYTKLLSGPQTCYACEGRGQVSGSFPCKACACRGWINNQANKCTTCSGSGTCFETKPCTLCLGTKTY